MTFILETLPVGDLEDLENPGEEIGSILTIAEEVEIGLPMARYKKIPLKDRTPIPVEKMRKVVGWIRGTSPRRRSSLRASMVGGGAHGLSLDTSVT
jgi:hypothetical protein